jgi:hypothetical protein
VFFALSCFRDLCETGKQIKRHLHEGPAPAAFRQLKKRLATSHSIVQE